MLVVVVARWRGLFALVGIAVTLLALTKFMLPAFLAGESPLVVVVVGSTAIMIAVLYLAHGVSIRTTSALFGTLFGIAMTAGMGVLATGWTNLTGVGSEDDQTLIATVPDLHLTGIVAAAMVIAGLGVLNDVTVTQASAVWELRALQPTARGRVDLRVGDAHRPRPHRLQRLHAGVRVRRLGHDRPAAHHGVPARARRDGDDRAARRRRSSARWSARSGWCSPFP